MSSPAIGSSGSDRIGRAARFASPLRAINIRPRSKAQVRRALEIVATVSVLMLIMFGGLALRAALVLSQGVD